jgi:hypothetical protein
MAEDRESAKDETPSARRLRRLQELGRDNQITRVNAALRQVWEQPGGPRPDQVRLRPSFLLASGAGSERRAAPMSRLITSRGIALRLYLLAIFEAQCRPGTGDPRPNTRPLSSRMGWSDLIVIDAAYSRPVKAYQRHSRQNRTLDSSLDRQIKGALRTLEQPEDQALVVIPRKANGRHRDYGSFLLMDESGRGEVPTPNYYTVPSPARGVIGIPYQLFLHGWIQVLYPSEIATWLTLRFLRSVFPHSHDESGVFLFGQTREENFHLLRDTYEDGCRNLLEFGLIRHAQPMRPTAEGASEAADMARLFMMAAHLPEVDENGRMRYQPNRYQLTDNGLENDALAVSMTTCQARRRAEDGVEQRNSR